MPGLESVPKYAWDAAVKWGFGTVALTAIAIVLWMSFDKQNAYIRETMAADSRTQTKVIEQNSEQLKQNSDHMKQSGEVMKSVVENNETTQRVVEKALDIIEKQSK